MKARAPDLFEWIHPKSPWIHEKDEEFIWLRMNAYTFNCIVISGESWSSKRAQYYIDNSHVVLRIHLWHNWDFTLSVRFLLISRISLAWQREFVRGKMRICWLLARILEKSHQGSEIFKNWLWIHRPIVYCHWRRENGQSRSPESSAALQNVLMGHDWSQSQRSAMRTPPI
jgi:hypothetical protein